MQLFVNGIGSLLSQFLSDVSLTSALTCFVACGCVAAALQLAQGRRLTRPLAVYCAALSLYATFIIAVTLLGRSPGLVADASQHPMTMEYESEAEHVIDIAYNTMLFAPFGFLLAMRQRAMVSSAIVVLATVAIEVIQMKTGRGLFEVSDIAGNIVGGVVGIFTCCAGRLAVRRFRKQIDPLG